MSADPSPRQVAIVTGASSGIGLGITQTLLDKLPGRHHQHRVG